MPGDILLSGEQAPTKTNPNPQDGSQRGTRGGVGARGGQVQYVTRRDGTTVARYTKKVSVHGVTANHSSDEEKQSVQIDGNSPISHESAGGETDGFQALARSIAQQIHYDHNTSNKYFPKIVRLVQAFLPVFVLIPPN